MMERIVLIGGGGHCKSMIDVICRQGAYEIAAITDQRDRIGQILCGFQVNYTDDDLESLYAAGIRMAAVSVGGIGDFSLRARLYKRAAEIGFQFPMICDPSAVVSVHTRIGDGVFIGKLCVVNAGTDIQSMAIINTGAIVEHDCRIGAFAFLSPAVTLSGGVTVGEHMHIGTGASIIQQVSIGAYSMIGAGSIVVKSMGDHVKAYGNPCREVKK